MGTTPLFVPLVYTKKRGLGKKSGVSSDGMNVENILTLLVEEHYVSGMYDSDG